MKIKELNENDFKLLEIILISDKSVNSLAKEVGISPSNISIRLSKLEQAGFIQVLRQEKKGMKTLIKINPNNKQKIKRVLRIFKRVLRILNLNFEIKK